MIRAIVLALAMFAALATPAAAHKLKVFATVTGDAVTGYAFFIGGGRAKGTPWVATEGTGEAFARGETDGEGRFHIVPPPPVTSDITVTVDTREGHIASATIPVARFGGEAAPPVTPDAPAPVAAAPADNGDVAALVEAAVQRQVEPLLERIEEMDSRLRFTDIMSGLFLIVGLAGIALWARSRRG